MSGLGILKSLPCPKGRSCTAFQCLFKHPGESDEVNKNDETQEDSPRKRVKTEETTTADSKKTAQIVSSGKPAVANIPSTGMASVNATSKPETTPSKKTITPSGMNRVSSLARVSTSASTQGAESAVKPATATSSKSLEASPSRTSSKRSNGKPEALNPRLLKKSPAKHDIRWKLLHALHEQYVRLNNEMKTIKEAQLLLTDQELITKALDDEEEIAIKKPAVYGNSLKNRIMNYKRMAVAQWREERLEATKEDGEITGPSPKLIETGLPPDQEVNFLHRIGTDLKGLERYGYITDVPKDEDVEKAKRAVEASGNYEQCDRCKTRFAVFPGRREEDGVLATNGPCTYHPGKTYFNDRRPGDQDRSEKKYRCCNQTTGYSNGCTKGEYHVFKATDESRLGIVLNFEKTPANPKVPANRAICFDCEMGYTVYGMELIRLTIISWPAYYELLDVLVLPKGEILDLNTRYSGVRQEDLVSAERLKPGDDHRPTIIPSTDPSRPPQRKLKLVPTPKEARDLFFSLISPETPLIGHGLENDLNAVRIIHPIVVDTVLLYPHKRGLPVRNGLKYLMETKLERKIQIDLSDDQMQGHDSAEDAKAAGDLVRLKIRDEWNKRRLQGWTLEDGKVEPPADNSWRIIGAKRKAN